MFAGITFAPKNRFRALQAADMLPYENFKHVTNRYAKEDPMPVRKLLTALDKSKRCSLGYYNEAALRNLRARFERFPGNWLSS
jgi:hypothetical protein